MTLNYIFKRLYGIDRDAQALLSQTGFTSDDGFGLQVCPDPANPEDRFLLDKAESLLQLFAELNEELRYLETPTHGEYTLRHLPNGRYGYYDKSGREHVFTCGKTLEAKLCDDDGHPYWVSTRIEHNGSDYFLWGHRLVPLSGLTIRERW